MQTYKVKYSTLGRGRNPKDKPGNVKQFSDIAYIQCNNTSEIKSLLDKHFEQPQPCGLYYWPVIEQITAIKGHCLVWYT